MKEVEAFFPKPGFETQKNFSPQRSSEFWPQVGKFLAFFQIPALSLQIEGESQKSSDLQRCRLRRFQVTLSETICVVSWSATKGGDIAGF